MLSAFKPPQTARPTLRARFKSLRHAFPLAALLIGQFSPIIFAAAPTVDWLYPLGGQVGTKFELTAGGSFDTWPASAWCNDPAVRIEAGKDKTKFNVVIETNAIPGLKLVRFYNPDGSSVPRLLMAGFLPEIAATEPNNNIETAQVVTNLPVTINGRFDKHNDNDTFALDLLPGKTLVARLDGYALGAPMDPLLHLYDSAGKRIAFNHDHANLDPLLAYDVAKAGRYYLQAMAFAHPASVDVAFAGKTACNYRLTITQGPFISHTQPMGLKVGATNDVVAQGWNLGSTNLHALVAAPADSGFFWQAAISNAPALVPVMLGAAAGQLETEPNNKFEEAQKYELPFSISGCIAAGDPKDMFRFTAKKGQNIHFELLTQALGFKLSALLFLYDSAGKELARSDEGSENRETSMNWNAGSDGDFAVAVTDFRRIGGPEFKYNITAEVRTPDFRPIMEAHSILLKAGQTNEIAVKLERMEGFKGKLIATAPGLLADCKLASTEVEAQDNVTLKIVAPAEAKAAQGPFELILEAPDQKLRHAAKFNMQGSDDEHGGKWLLGETTNLWFTVEAKK